MKTLRDYIVTIPDFPKPGVMFRDVTSVLDNPDGFQLAVDELMKLLDGVARGFLFGGPIAYNHHKALIPIRKKGKLPRETVEATYDLEYGTATIEVHKDAIKPGQKVVIIDDLIATGGTVEAAARLVEELGGEVVKMLFLIELPELGGRAKLAKYDVASAVCFDGE